MPQVSVDVEEFVQRKLASGEFASREELTQEALRVYRELEERYSTFRNTVRERIAEADRGEVEPMDVESIKAELRRELGE